MTAIASPTDGETSGSDGSERRGTLLKPSTVGVLKDALSFYLQGNLDFMDVYFPQISSRRHVVWGDVFALSATQADALRPIMVESIRHFLKQDARDRNRNVSLLTRALEDPEFVSFHGRKAKYWTDALRDLCQTFGLESPI